MRRYGARAWRDGAIGGTVQGEPAVVRSGAMLLAYRVMSRYARLSQTSGKEKRRKTGSVQAYEILARSGRLVRTVRCYLFRCSTLHVPWGKKNHSPCQPAGRNQYKG
jgi:hypothetical protein